MVSLKLDNNLVSIGEILKSDFKRNSSGFFGIQENDLIDIIKRSCKVNAFISTIIEIAQHYNLTSREFFLGLCVRIRRHNYFENWSRKF
jgi:hypothetical protein